MDREISKVGLTISRCVATAGLIIGLCATPAYAADGRGGEVRADSYVNAIVFTFGRYYPRDAVPAPRGSAWAANLGLERQYQSGLRLGIDISLYHSKYDTPPVSGGPFTVVDDDMSLSTIGFNGTAAWAWRLGAAEARAGAGLGLYSSTMRAYATTLGFPGWHDENDVNAGYSAFLALDFRTGPTSRFGLEARRLSLKADFGPLSNNNRLAIGGNALFFTYRHSFGPGAAF